MNDVAVSEEHGHETGSKAGISGSSFTGVGPNMEVSYTSHDTITIDRKTKGWRCGKYVERCKLPFFPFFHAKLLLQIFS